MKLRNGLALLIALGLFLSVALSGCGKEQAAKKTPPPIGPPPAEGPQTKAPKKAPAAPAKTPAAPKQAPMNE